MQTWKNQVQDCRNPKNNNGPTSFRSSYHHSTAPLQHAAVAGHPKVMSYSAVAKGMLGNTKAAFATNPQTGAAIKINVGGQLAQFQILIYLNLHFTWLLLSVIWKTQNI